MEGSSKKGVVKHLVLAKFKEGVPDSKIEELAKAFANLVDLIEPMKALRWGTNVSVENFHQGFTHVFESTFENTEDVKVYVDHPAHVEYANLLSPFLEKVIVIDYQPTSVAL